MFDEIEKRGVILAKPEYERDVKNSLDGRVGKDCCYIERAEKKL